MSQHHRIAIVAAAVLLAAPIAAAQQPKAPTQTAPTDEQAERKLFDATSNLESELKRLDNDLDALIDKAGASQQTGPVAPGQQPGAVSQPKR